MKSKMDLGARAILGLIFVIFGLNGFLQFIPMPPPPEHMMAFFNGMMATKYMFPLVKGLEVICGLALLTNLFVPLALLVLAPICVNILLLHIFVAPEGLPMAILVTALGLIIAWARCEKFAPLLKAK